MKKIATVSVLAIMAVSAARADIASTSYVDKTAAGAVTTGLADGGNIKAAIKTATTDMATQTWVTNTATAAKATADADGNVIDETYALQSKVGDVSLSETNYMKTDTNLTAAVISLDSALSGVVAGEVDTTKIPDGSIAKVKLTTELQNQIDGAATQEALNGVSATASAANTQAGENKTAIQALQNAGYQNAGQVSAAISTATTDPNGVIKQALDGKVDDSEIANMAEKSDIHDNTLTITVNNANAQTFTANAAADKIINIPVPTTVGELTNDANYQNADQVSAAISTATTAENGAVKTAIDNALGSYSTTEQMNTALNAKQDKTTAVTHAENTAVGDASHAVYIDSTGAAQRIEKVASASAADSATTAGTADDYNETSGTIKEKFDGVDTSLAKVAAFGQVPAVPDACVAGTADCTLVIAYTAEKGLTHTWEKIAR